MARDPRALKSERKLATVRVVADKRPIEGADLIEMVVIDGWECVVKKEENLNIGDPVVYIEIDSIVPDRPEFEFLRPRKFRVRTIKLRGQVSQGLVLPLSILRGKKYKVGDDVTDELGILKYDPELLKERTQSIPKPTSWLGKFLMKFKWYQNWRRRKYGQKVFPGWIAKTDESRVQNIVKVFNEHQTKNTEFFVTEKLDGQSFTIFIDAKNKVGIASRNLQVSTKVKSNYSVMFEKANLGEVITNIKKETGASRVVIQGELCGPGIQKNKYKLDDFDFYVFNLITDNTKNNYTVMKSIVERHGLKTVPLLEESYTLPETISDIVEYSKGNSTLLESQKREGIVVRDLKYNTSFKVINPDFLLEEKDEDEE